jgi:hypothetical protein
MVAKAETRLAQKRIKRRPGQRAIAGKDFQLAEEIRYIQDRAAERDGRFVTAGSLLFFSTETGDAWVLDPGDQLAARLARDGDPEYIYTEEDDARFAIQWTGTYRIDGSSFIYADQQTGRVSTILGYPTQRLDQLGLEISNIFG